MVEAEVLTYMTDMLGDEILPVDTIFSEISEAPAEVKRYLERQCRTSEELEEYLRNNSDHFMVENKRVGVYDLLLESGRAKAVDYFKEALRLYNEPPNQIKFRSHLGQAGEDVVDFVNCFYPGEEFRNFLFNHPDVFVMFGDDSVYLIENESVDYFENCLNECDDGLYFMDLRGRVSQAPPYVTNFINRRYPGEKFLEFLEDNSDVFSVENGYVCLNPDE